MHYYVMTLFPEMILSGVCTSITGKAVEKGIISVETFNIRDYTDNKHGRVDDYTYGGGAGMLMRPEPVYRTYRAVEEHILTQGRRKPQVVYLTPQGESFTQKMAQELASKEELVFLCGRYEGVDERVLEEIGARPVSIGDYVLTGGELPAMVMIDAVSRLVPGVLHNEESAVSESFEDELLEYPQYSRPEVWNGKQVPEVLLSGHHANIDKWRREKALERTRLRRPDLYERYQRNQGLKEDT